MKAKRSGGSRSRAAVRPTKRNPRQGLPKGWDGPTPADPAVRDKVERYVRRYKHRPVENFAVAEALGLEPVAVHLALNELVRMKRIREVPDPSNDIPPDGPHSAWMAWMKARDPTYEWDGCATPDAPHVPTPYMIATLKKALAQKPIGPFTREEFMAYLDRLDGRRKGRSKIHRSRRS